MTEHSAAFWLRKSASALLLLCEKLPEASLSWGEQLLLGGGAVRGLPGFAARVPGQKSVPGSGQWQRMCLGLCWVQGAPGD